MPKSKSLKEVYENCESEGMIREMFEFNHQKILDMSENAQTYVDTAELLIKNIEKSDKRWMSVYVNYYEALRILSETLIHFENKKITNHQCLFAFLCTKFKLDLDYMFFEMIRTKRNGINYYGGKIEYQDWKEVEFQMKLYAKTLKGEIKKRLNELE